MGGYGTGLYGTGLYGVGLSNTATDLTALCDSLLAASIDALDTLPDLGLLGAPERAFVAPGQPAFDCCDQLTVNWVTTTEDATTGQSARGRTDVSSHINLVGLAVTITRCVPTGSVSEGVFTPPSAEDQAEAAAQINADAWALWNHLWNLWKAGLLFSMCGKVYWDGQRSLTNSGGCGGSVLSIRVRLDGYNDVP